MLAVHIARRTEILGMTKLAQNISCHTMLRVMLKGRAMTRLQMTWTWPNSQLYQERNTESATATFLDAISRPLPPALLHYQQAGTAVSSDAGDAHLPQCGKASASRPSAPHEASRRPGRRRTHNRRPVPALRQSLPGTAKQPAVMALTALCGLDDTTGLWMRGAELLPTDGDNELALYRCECPRYSLRDSNNDTNALGRRSLRTAISLPTYGDSSFESNSKPSHQV